MYVYVYTYVYINDPTGHKAWSKKKIHRISLILYEEFYMNL